MLCSIVKERIR